jgi:hypothetical protein
MLRIPHCLDSRPKNGVRLSALRTGRALLPRNIIFLFLVLIFADDVAVRSAVFPGRIILKWILEMCDVDWIDLASMKCC